MIFHVHSHKGGQGTSTVAAALALSFDGPALLIDASPQGDVDGILALHYIEPGAPTVAGNVRYIRTFNPVQHLPFNDIPVVIDWGTNIPRDVDGDDQRILVIRPCYLAIRAAIRHERPQHVVVIREPLRALRTDDLVSALNPTGDVTTIDLDASVARAVDAGLLTANIPRVLRPLRHHTGAPA